MKKTKRNACNSRVTCCKAFDILLCVCHVNKCRDMIGDCLCMCVCNRLILMIVLQYEKFVVCVLLDELSRTVFFDFFFFYFMKKGNGN